MRVGKSQTRSAAEVGAANECARSFCMSVGIRYHRPPSSDLTAGSSGITAILRSSKSTISQYEASFEAIACPVSKCERMRWVAVMNASQGELHVHKDRFWTGRMSNGLSTMLSVNRMKYRIV